MMSGLTIIGVLVGISHDLSRGVVAHGRLCTQAASSKGPGTVTDPLAPKLPEIHLETLRAPYCLLDDRALQTYEPGAAEATDWMKPPSWSGNYWGPAATRARSAGNLPPLPSSPEMGRWNRWGVEVLRPGDIVFRLGDGPRGRAADWCPSAISSPSPPAVPSRTPASSRSRTDHRSFMTARPRDFSASRSRSGCSTAWVPGGEMVKAGAPRAHSLGVIGYCRSAYERQVPFDNSFRMEDDSLYCLELTEKAFRSQGLALSEPVRIGDWEYLGSFPLTALLIPARIRNDAGSPDHTRATGVLAR